MDASAPDLVLSAVSFVPSVAFGLRERDLRSGLPESSCLDSPLAWDFAPRVSFDFALEALEEGWAACSSKML